MAKWGQKLVRFLVIFCQKIRFTSKGVKKERSEPIEEFLIFLIKLLFDLAAFHIKPDC